MDEHEALIEYSEMTTFDFNSKEYQEVRRDYLECKNFVSEILWRLSDFWNSLRPAKNY